MAQNYKVFIDNKTITFTEKFSHEENIISTEVKSINNENFRYLDFIDFYHNNKILNLIIETPIIDKTFKKFCNDFHFIHAAGGLVENEKNEFLLIYRLEKWDLPKGKIDKNESSGSAALREVMEECGIHNILLEKFLQSTYHMYQLKNHWIIKQTDWFKMNYTGNECLTAQTEEDITEVAWLNKNQITDILDKTYPLIRELLLKHVF